MTQCPVREVMTEIYTLLLELGPCELPQETLPLSSRSRKREDRDRAQITANALNRQAQDNMLIRSIIVVLSLPCVFISPFFSKYKPDHRIKF